ncbi:MAG: LysR family transcriptional regulator substrate-binding protein [Hyphomicrobiales bacterium]|nr:LysR family transcriptional regulator substrate-binding protein [Hyphomicrobiales bacterium]
MLTAQGQVLLGDCRTLLSCATAIGERAQSLQEGDAGVLKVAAGPQFIEGALADFLRLYADRYPKVQVRLIEAIGWAEIAAMLDRGDIHLGQNLLRAVQSDDERFGSHRLAPVGLLAVCRSPEALETIGRSIDITRLAKHPLLVLDTSYVFRRSFDAACRLAGVEPTIAYESRTPLTLLAMAESGHGVAIVPSTMHISRHPVHISAITFRGRALREPLAIYWDKRRSLPRYAIAFYEMLTEYVRKVFPISRPTPADTATKNTVTKRAPIRKRG